MEAADNAGGLCSTRKATVPFALALGLSVILHAGFFYVLPASVGRQRPPKANAVIVDLGPPREAIRGAPTPPNVPELAERRDDTLTKKKLPLSTEAPPTPAAGDAGTPETPATPATPHDNMGDHPTEPNPTREVTWALPPSAVEPKGQPKGEISAAKERPRTLTIPPAGPTSDKRTKTLTALMPTPKELAPFRASKLPDPAGGTAREATLGLGETDARYQGYVDQVRTGIYAGWHMGRGLVVAGSARRVVVGFSLTSLGMVENPRITESSGNSTLDTEAVDAVRRAKLSPFPSHWTIEKLYLFAVFDYDFR
jgi:TonB family protein